MFSHLLSTNHKSTHPCLIVVQKRTMRWNTTVTSRSSRSIHQSSSCGKPCWRFRLCYRWNVKTFVSIIGVCNKVLIFYFVYIVEHCLWYIHLWRLPFVWNMILTHIWGTYGLLFETGCDMLALPMLFAPLAGTWALWILLVIVWGRR